MWYHDYDTVIGSKNDVSSHGNLYLRIIYGNNNNNSNNRCRRQHCLASDRIGSDQIRSAASQPDTHTHIDMNLPTARMATYRNATQRHHTRKVRMLHVFCPNERHERLYAPPNVVVVVVLLPAFVCCSFAFSSAHFNYGRIQSSVPRFKLQPPTSLPTARALPITCGAIRTRCTSTGHK